VSRIISGRLSLDVQEVDLTAVIESAIESVKPAAEAKGIRLEHHLDSLSERVMGDPNRLQQVMSNLLSNAIKFTPRAGQVKVSLLHEGTHAQITVSDTGIGIDPAFVPHIFERFRQADASTTRRYGGLGLGLAIVRHLVELLGGTVEVASAGKDQGASFTVKLPLSMRQSEIVAGAPPPAIGCRGSWASGDDPVDLTGVRVLVVDDEPDARELIGRILAEHHMEVRTAGSAAEALAAFDEGWPMVLVSDISMPEEDGYALIRRVRRLPQERGGSVPALALTAFARAEDRARAISEGYQMHLTKPVKPWELLAYVSRLAGRIKRLPRPA
jgi:CheY-like chemotaxis protein/two-component sensor histidine kinase